MNIHCQLMLSASVMAKTRGTWLTFGNVAERLFRQGFRSVAGIVAGIGA